MTKNLLTIALATLLFTLVGCGEKKSTSDAQLLTGAVSIDGSSTVYPITEAVAEEFRKIQPNVNVSVGLSGTGGGFKKFGRGEIDINDASRSIKKEEVELAESNNIHFVEMLVAYDGLAVIVNPANTWCTEITVAELKKIWEPEAQGKIKKWNQIRSNWPNEEIHLYGPGTESGTYDYFTEAIVGKSHSSRGDFTASEDDNVLVQGVSTDKNALGFFGLAYFEENKDKLKLVAVDNGKGGVLPSLATVRDKSYSPLARPLYIYLNSKAGEKPEVQTFLSFYLDNASKLVTEVGYIPLTDEETAAEKAKFEEFIKTHSAAK